MAYLMRQCVDTVISLLIAHRISQSYSGRPSPQQRRLRVDASGSGRWGQHIDEHLQGTVARGDYRLGIIDTDGVVIVQSVGNSRILCNTVVFLFHVKPVFHVMCYCPPNSSGDVDFQYNCRFQGDCIPTAGGGTAVCFNDVEHLSHEAPGQSIGKKRKSRSTKKTVRF